MCVFVVTFHTCVYEGTSTVGTPDALTLWVSALPQGSWMRIAVDLPPGAYDVTCRKRHFFRDAPSSPSLPMAVAPDKDGVDADHCYLDAAAGLLHLHIEGDADFFQTRAAVSNTPHDRYLSRENKVRIDVTLRCPIYRSAGVCYHHHFTTYDRQEVPAERAFAWPPLPAWPRDSDVSALSRTSYPALPWLLSRRGEPRIG